MEIVPTKKLLPENGNVFFCKRCDYTTCKKSSWNKHLTTSKHNSNIIEIVSNNTLCTNCNKKYKDRSGLWYHMKKCKKNSNNGNNGKVEQNSELKILAELFKIQMNDNQEFKELLLEQNKQLMEKNMENQKLQQQLLEMACKMGSTTNTNTNTNCNNNNQFNLQFFLNETCKDALNLTDFVEQIKLQLSDLDMIGRVGYVEGITKIFLRNLKDIDVCKRPIHCSDLKRETLYVKDKNAWEKANGENIKIKRAIKQVECKNIKQIPKWRAENPTAEDTETKKHLEYQNILLEAMGGSTLEDDNKKHEKIIKNIAKEVVIDKNAVK